MRRYKFYLLLNEGILVQSRLSRRKLMKRYGYGKMAKLSRRQALKLFEV